MKVSAEEKTKLPEYSEKIDHLIWSIPSVHNVAGTLARGLVIILVVETEGSKSRDRLRAFRVGPSYSLGLLDKNSLSKVQFVWNEVHKTSKNRIIAIGAKKKLSERSLRKALFEDNLLGGKDKLSKKKEKSRSDRSSRRMFFDLDDEMTFGKHGPQDGKPGKLVREIIDKDKGWITWAISKFGGNFLNVPAMNYFNESKRK